jgi:hypothetical protein
MTDTLLHDPLLASLRQAIAIKATQIVLDLGRSKIYEELGAGNLTAVKDGTRTLITVESIRRYQANRPQAKFNPAPRKRKAVAR